MKKIKYENKTIAYTVNKSKIKNVYISIQNGEVVVNAPWYVTGNQIQEVVESKRAWIMRNLDAYKSSPRRATEYIHGDRSPILGENYYSTIYFKQINHAK